MSNLEKLKNYLPYYTDKIYEDDKNKYREHLDNVDLNDLHEKINCFRMLNFKNLSYETIIEELTNVLSIKINRRTQYMLNEQLGYYKKGTRFYRVRKLDKDDINIPFKSIKYPKDVWCPPNEIVKLGRLNREKESLLYTTPNSPQVAVEEMKIREGEYFVVAVYEAIEDIKIAYIGISSNLDYLNKEQNIKHKMINDFLIHEFIRDVGEGTEYLYRITEIITKKFFNNHINEMDGWCYPSIAYKENQVNVCLKENKAIKKLRMIGINTGKMENNEIFIDCIGLPWGKNNEFEYCPVGGEIQKEYFPEVYLRD